MAAPLADRIRPDSLDDVVGQAHLLGPGAVLRRMVADGRLTQFEKRYYLAHQPEEQQAR